MIKGKNNLDYEYFNRYLANCGSLDPTDMSLISSFFREKLKILPEYEIDPKEMVFLNELVTFCREKFDSSNLENTN
jgi:hypothetical protein